MIWCQHLCNGLFCFIFHMGVLNYSIITYQGNNFLFEHLKKRAPFVENQQGVSCVHGDGNSIFSQLLVEVQHNTWNSFHRSFHIFCSISLRLLPTPRFKVFTHPSLCTPWTCKSSVQGKIFFPVLLLVGNTVKFPKGTYFARFCSFCIYGGNMKSTLDLRTELPSAKIIIKEGEKNIVSSRSFVQKQ